MVSNVPVWLEERFSSERKLIYDIPLKEFDVCLKQIREGYYDCIDNKIDRALPIITGFEMNGFGLILYS